VRKEGLTLVPEELELAIISFVSHSGSWPEGLRKIQFQTIAEKKNPNQVSIFLSNRFFF
jgi:hypothetical protein